MRKFVGCGRMPHGGTDFIFVVFTNRQQDSTWKKAVCGGRSGLRKLE
ncbi:SH3 domain-containing protein [Eisenbergiella porci]|nr:hypothetical protein [Eisenbergiella porci]